MIVTCQRRFINCNKYITLVRMLIMEEAVHGGGAGYRREPSVAST